MTFFNWNPLKQIIQSFSTINKIDSHVYNAIYQNAQNEKKDPLTTKTLVQEMKKKFSIASEKTLSTIQKMQRHNRDGALIEVTNEEIIIPTDRFY